MLCEAAASPQALQRLSNGAWLAGAGGPWRSISAATDVFGDHAAGRRALLAWMLEHAACAALLSPSRCLALAEAGPGTWRVWQIYRATPSLRSWLLAAAWRPAGALHGRLVRAAATLGEAHASFAGTPLVATLDAVGAPADRPQYVWPMPYPGAPRPAVRLHVEDAVARELRNLLATELSGRLGELAAALRTGGPRTSPPSRWEALVAGAIADLRR